MRREPDGLMHADVGLRFTRQARRGSRLRGSLRKSHVRPWVDPGNPNAGDNSYNDARILVSLL
jgi:hypothetical protein